MVALVDFGGFALNVEANDCGGSHGLGLGSGLSKSVNCIYIYRGVHTRNTLRVTIRMRAR